MPMSHLHKFYKTEILSKYMANIIDNAVRVWKSKSVPDGEIANKIDQLQNDLERMPKRQLVQTINYYIREGQKISALKNNV